MLHHNLLPALGALALVTACGGGGGLDPAAPAPPFALDGPYVSAVQDEAQVSWSTSQPSTATVLWGPSGGPLETITLNGATPGHSLPLTGLSPDTEYLVRVEVQNASGETVTSDDLVFQTAALLAFGQDDFNTANLDRARWSMVDPTGAGEVRLVGTGTGDAHLELEVPAGHASLPWISSNGALRVVQNAPSGDWSLTARFEGPLDTGGTGHGLMVEVDTDTFLRFDFAFNSNKVLVFAALLDGGSVIDSFSDVIQTGTWAEGIPLWMRVTRAGQGWTQEWSSDGSAWFPGAVFTDAAVPSTVGFHAVTASESTGAHRVVIDYLLDSGADPGAEDQNPAPDSLAPWLYRSSAASLDENSVEVRWWSDEPTTAEIEYGLDTTYSSGTTQVTDALYEHVAVVDGLLAGETYHFRIRAQDAAGHTSVSGDLSATTAPPNETLPPAFELWYGEAEADDWVLRCGHLGNAQTAVNVLGNISDDDEDRIALSVSLYYQLNGGSWQLAALGDDRDISYVPWRLANEGDFNVELDVDDLSAVPLSDGVHRNSLLLEALDDDGNATYQTVYVDYTPGVTWNPTTSIDWSTVTDLTDACQVVDGEWYVDDHPSLGAGLRIANDGLGYDRLVAIGEGHGSDAWEDYEVTVTGHVLGLDPKGWTDGTQSYAMGLGLRWSGHTPGWGPSQPDHDIYPFGGIFVHRWFQTFERWELWINHDETILPFDAEVLVGQTYVFKARCETQPGGGTRYRIKRWLETDPEPGAWDFDYTTPAADDHPEGSLLLISHHVDVLFGDVIVTEL